MTSGNNDSDVFVGTTCDYWVYVPRQSTIDVVSNLMVFQEGESYKASEKQMNIPATADKMIEDGIIAPPRHWFWERVSRHWLHLAIRVASSGDVNGDVFEDLIIHTGAGDELRCAGADRLYGCGGADHL